MHRPRKVVSVALICFAALAIVATVSLGAVIGSRQTAIISPPGGSPAADGPSDAISSSHVLPYTFDGARPGGTTPSSDPVVDLPRPADNVEFSQDGRVVKYVAFDSSARNLVTNPAGDGHSHVFLLTRDGLGGTLQQVDPNDSGDSIKPSVDGQTKSGNGTEAPHCVVFQSTSTLARKDKSSKWSIYLYDTDTKKISLVSKPGQNARDGVVDGECSTVSYEAGGRIYVRWLGHACCLEVTPDKKQADSYDPDQETDGKGVAYDRHGQVYWQAFEVASVISPGEKHHHDELQLRGHEQLISVTPQGKPGNGPSQMPSANDNGTYIAFESQATDLCDGSKAWCGTTDDNGPTLDVFRRTQPSRATRHTPPTDDQMEMIDYDSRIENPPFQADMGSDQVKISGAGEQACFRSFGTEARQRKFGVLPLTGPFEHIYYWNFPREKMTGAFTGESREAAGKDSEFHRDDNSGAFSWSCAISNRGNYIAWTSDDEHQAGEQNGRAIPDMFLRFMGASDEGLGGNLG